MSRGPLTAVVAARRSTVASAVIVGAVLAFTAAGGLGVAGCTERSRRPNILLIVLDTVRADHVSSYGYERRTTPNLDRLAAHGIRYANASSTSSWTLPAHASLFTGLMPIRHGATQENRSLGDAYATLAELLSDAGYATIGVSGNPLVSDATGLSRGFERFESSDEVAVPGDLAAHPNVAAMRRFWRERTDDRPFFAFVNFIEAHGPYDPPEPWRSSFRRGARGARLAHVLNEGGASAYYASGVSGGPATFAALSDLYDGEVAYVDALVGALIAELERAGLADDTVVVALSDHGENLGDHGHFRHVFSLYASTVHIPLIVRVPGDARAGEVRPEAVGLAELFPTILALGGATPPDGQTGGRDLLAAAPLEEVPVFAEYYYPVQALGCLPAGIAADPPARLALLLRRLRSVELGGLRLVWSSSGDRELYDLAVDPNELTDVAGWETYGARRDALDALVRRYVDAAGGDRPLPDPSAAAVASAPFGRVRDDVHRRLRALGYVR